MIPTAKEASLPTACFRTEDKIEELQNYFNAEAETIDMYIHVSTPRVLFF